MHEKYSFLADKNCFFFPELHRRRENRLWCRSLAAFYPTYQARDEKKIIKNAIKCKVIQRGARDANTNRHEFLVELFLFSEFEHSRILCKSISNATFHVCF
jgi:hypothetical protein